MYQNALLATDGSKVAEAVFKEVVQVLHPDGRVTIVHVIDDIAQVFAQTTPAGFDVGAGFLAPQLAEEVVAAQRNAAERHLEHASETLREAGVSAVETVILSGVPGEAIIEEARRRGADVVLMGTHGRSGLRRTVLGSVADYVLRHLERTPIVLVHAGED